MPLTTPTPPSPSRSLGDPRPLPKVEGFVTAGEALESALADSPLGKALTELEAEISKDRAA